MTELDDLAHVCGLENKHMELMHMIHYSTHISGGGRHVGSACFEGDDMSPTIACGSPRSHLAPMPNKLS